MNTINIDEMQQELFNLPASAVDDTGCLLRDFYFFKVGYPIQGIKDWIKDTKEGKRVDYSAFGTTLEGFK